MLKTCLVKLVTAAAWLTLSAAAQAGVVVQTVDLDLTRTDTNVTNACGFPGTGGNNCVGYSFISASPLFQPFDTSLGILTSATLLVDVNGRVDATGFGSASFAYSTLTDSAEFSPSLGASRPLALAGPLDLMSLAAVTGNSDFIPFSFNGTLNHTGFFPATVTMSALGTFSLTYEYRLRDTGPGTGGSVSLPGSLPLLLLGIAGLAVTRRRQTSN